MPFAPNSSKTNRVSEPRPNMPERRPPAPADAASKQQGSLFPVLVVLGFALGAVLVIISCAGTAGALVVVAVGAGIGFIALQYLIWGWWLTRKLKDEQREDTEK